MKEKEKEEKEEFISSSGSPFYTPVDYKYSEEYKCFVPIPGKTINRYEMIQACTPSTDINYIVKRALAGDITALRVGVGSYADISNIPDNLNDIHEFSNLGVKGFNSLDNNIKALFDNDFNKFSESVADNSYVEIINNYVESLKKEKVEQKESEN